MTGSSGAAGIRVDPRPAKRSLASRNFAVTPRQAEILSLVARGMGDKEIADRLGVAPRTIRTHLERLYREYGMSSRSQALAAWLRTKHRH